MRCSVTQTNVPSGHNIYYWSSNKKRRDWKTQIRKNSKKTSISSFKINAIADVYLGKVPRIFWHSTFITAAVQHDIVIHREFSQAAADVDTNWKIQRTMETIEKLGFNIQNSVLRKKKKDSYRTTVQCKLFEKLTILQGNSGEFMYYIKQTSMVWALKQNELNRIVTNPPGGLSVISKSQKTVKGSGNKFWNCYY